MTPTNFAMALRAGRFVKYQKNRINIALLLIGMLSITSCSKDFVPNIEGIGNTVVVNSFIDNTEVIKISVTESLPLSNGAVQKVKVRELRDAKVSLFEDGQYVEDLAFAKLVEDSIGYFRSSFIPEINANYTVTVEVGEEEETRASAQVPQGAIITNPEVNFVSGNAFDVSFQYDDPAEKNYYYLQMYFKGHVVNKETGEEIIEEELRAEIPKGSLPEVQEYLFNGYLFKDDLFEGATVNFSGIVRSGLVSNIFPPDFTPNKETEVKMDTTQLFIRLETLSEEAYQYKSSHAIYLQRGLDLSVEPVSIFSNVENGFGIFAGVHVSEVGVDVE